MCLRFNLNHSPKAVVSHCQSEEVAEGRASSHLPHEKDFANTKPIRSPNQATQNTLKEAKLKAEVTTKTNSTRVQNTLGSDFVLPRDV